MLAFNKSPNYESATGGGTDTDSNIYSVTLRAAVVDAEETGSPGNTDIEDTEMDTVSIMVGVTGVEETPAFSEASDTLTVDEHVKADTDVHRNVSSPVTAKDSDGDALLTYSLSGTDAGYFTIVPATGQVKTMMKLDYETKNSFSVVVTATDPTDRKDTINITIEVEDVAEAPDIVPDGIAISGEPDVDYNENGRDAVGTYTVGGPDAASARWTLQGADSGDFSMDPTSGASSMLKFRSSPDFEAPADADTNNTYMVTVKVEVDGDIDTQDVTVTVTNVSELGTLAGMESISYAENGIDAVGTYTVSGANAAMATWTLEGADSGDFSIDRSGASSMLKFRSSPDFEAPADADTNNTYMVTVKATIGGEMATQDVTVTVTDVDDSPVDPMDPVDTYDDNGISGIQIDELLNAIDDFFDPAVSLDLSDLLDVLDAFFG